MLPVTLESRAEQIFEEIGGLNAASRYFRQEEITDICLFNGFTEILFPFYEPFEGTLENGLYDYRSIDLTLINYEPGGHICITDQYYQPLYNRLITSEVIDGKLSYYFGRSAADKEFLSTCSDGQLLFMVYNSKNSTNLAQIIISHKLPSSVVKLNRDLWEAGLKKVSLEPAAYGELVLRNLEDKLVTVFRREAPLKDNLSEQEIVYGRSSDRYEMTGKDLYLKFSRDTWLCFREYSVYTEPGITEIDDQSELKTFLQSNGYSETAATDQGYVMTKSAGGFIQEVIVTVEEDSTVDTVTSAKYKVLSLTNLSGTNIDYIKTIANCLYLNIKTSHIYSNINTETKLISKSVFKAEAELINV